MLRKSSFRKRKKKRKKEKFPNSPGRQLFSLSPKPPHGTTIP
jgi:hypothetical protein